MALNNRDQSLGILLGCVLACAAIWYFWLAPTTRSITTASQQVTSLTNDQSLLKQRIAFIDATQKDLASNPEGQNLVSLAAPVGSDINNLLSSLNAMAVSSGVTLSSIQPQETADKSGQLALTISVSGTFSATQAFVAAVEKNERPIAIKTMSLSSSATSGGSTIVATTLNLMAVQVAAPAKTSTSTTGGTQ